MGHVRRSGAVAFLVVLGAGTALAAAESVTREAILVPPVDHAAVTALAPKSGATSAQRFTLTPAPFPPSFHTFAELFASAPQPQDSAQEAQTVEARTGSAALPPLPPVRAVASASVPGRAPDLAAPPPTLMPPSALATPLSGEPMPDREIVERANAYFTNLGTLVARFTQIGGDGRRLGGELYLQRPGKLRFEYDPPATLQVIADGSSVAVRDKKLATQDLYSISQTPLKFLLRDRVNLGRDIKITNIEQDGDSVRVSLEDRSTLGGTSKITLYFDPRVESLTQWRITDPQGFQTTVMLEDVDRTKRIDQAMFAISYDHVINTDNPNR